MSRMPRDRRVTATHPRIRDVDVIASLPREHVVATSTSSHRCHASTSSRHRSHRIAATRARHRDIEVIASLPREDDRGPPRMRKWGLRANVARRFAPRIRPPAPARAASSRCSSSRPAGRPPPPRWTVGDARIRCCMRRRASGGRCTVYGGRNQCRNRRKGSCVSNRTVHPPVPGPCSGIPPG